MVRGKKVERPTKKSEYEIVFASSDAEKGWRDLRSTIRGPLADAWDFLTRTPLVETPRNYRLRDELATVTRGGRNYQQWQHKPTAKGDARIWFYVEGQVVHLTEVHTHHPNQTK